MRLATRGHSMLNVPPKPQQFAMSGMSTTS